MKIYTGFGDRGETSLFGGEKVLKNHPRVELYGTLDELNSIIGLLNSKTDLDELFAIFERVQNEIFVISSEIATPDENRRKQFKDLIVQTHSKTLEHEIDRFSEQLPPLKQFILPGGHEAAALSHLARTVCRRAERLLISLNEKEAVRSDLLIYLNRLSDFFFVCARFINHKKQKPDVTWKGR